MTKRNYGEEEFIYPEAYDEPFDEVLGEASEEDYENIQKLIKCGITHHATNIDFKNMKNISFTLVDNSNITMEEIQNRESQKEVLHILEKEGFGIMIDGFGVMPIPLFFENKHYPVQLSSKTGDLIKIQSWNELEMFVQNYINKKEL